MVEMILLGLVMFIFIWAVVYCIGIAVLQWAGAL